MHKQCNQCGDYYFTTMPDRQFCSHACADIAPREKPFIGTQIVPRKKLKRLDGSDAIPCDICGVLTFTPLLEKIKWNKKSLVCPLCLSGFEVRAEEEGLDTSDFLSVSLEME